MKKALIAIVLVALVLTAIAIASYTPSKVVAQYVVGGEIITEEKPSVNPAIILAIVVIALAAGFIISKKIVK